SDRGRRSGPSGSDQSPFADLTGLAERGVYHAQRPRLFARRRGLGVTAVDHAFRVGDGRLDGRGDPEHGAADRDGHEQPSTPAQTSKLVHVASFGEWAWESATVSET